MKEKIEFRTNDLIIGSYTDKETGEKKKILRVCSHLAFDEDFIQEMKDLGVKEMVERGSDGEEVDE